MREFIQLKNEKQKLVKKIDNFGRILEKFQSENDQLKA